jgi:hypothetical protein
MPAINLPNNESAVIKTRSELSERSVRAITKSFMTTGAIVAKMTEQGFKDNDPNTWHIWNDLDDADVNNVNAYQAVLILNMVKSWTLGELPTADTVEDLPSPVFQSLAAACANEFNKVLDFSPDGATDPLVPTAGSTD